MLALLYAFLKVPLASGARRLLNLGLIALPIELLALGLSGRSYEHYYITLLPVAMVLSTFVLWILWRSLPDPTRPRVQLAYAAALLALLLGANYSILGELTHPDRPYRRTYW